MKTRRDFLRMTAASASATMIPPSIQRALAIPAHRSTGTIRDVEHVVILMQENRSFDHYFGSLRGVRGFSDPRPAPLPNGKPVWYQPPPSTKTKHYQSRGLSPDAPHVLPFYLNPKATTEYQDGTDHGWSSGHLSWNHGRYDQWVTQKQDALTMGYLKREDVSFHYALADAFTLCDAYFCSVHADTCPNRIYLWSGTCDPRNIHGKKPNGPGIEERSKTNGYTWMTYPERLQEQGVSWKVYQGGTGIPGTPTDNYTDNSLEFFANYQVMEGASPSGPLVTQGVSNHTLRDLHEDVTQGRLPQVSWIIAPYKYCEHPEASPTDGAYFVSLVLEALTSNPEVWSKTVFFINYDENDGLFDHVVPPMPPSSQARNAHGMVSDDLLESLQDELLDLDQYPHEKNPIIPGADPGGLQPIGLGPRVPMLIVSPWTTGGWVCSQVFDHTSVLQFLEARFGVAEPNITKWRRSVCGDLTSAFNFANPVTSPSTSFRVPKPVRSRHEPYQVPAMQVMPSQEPGTRLARALPYDIQTQCRVETSRVWVDLINRGKAGASFYIYDGTALSNEPRRYTVSAGQSLSDFWMPNAESSAYDLSLYGPNGYHAHFQGSITQSTTPGSSHEASLDYVPESKSIRITIRNSGAEPCVFEVSEAYNSVAVQKYTVNGTGNAEVHVPVSSSSGWFDVIVQTRQDTYFLRRWAGHLEDGRPSTSDPGLNHSISEPSS
ncbi:phosphocholine-specific phospholipase C [Granulicella arctica]|uniref:phospholipase C n=1 Tax=Granulicella arctica TaxID=940613 RepID=A0A7Y9PJ45_9BACT|nr:phospholipase C, phosphocholine-specific [Granulicella arctica]NYF80028.1 phospholipase C [Granulicella arctica]